MDALIRNLLAAFKVGIDELEWMSPETKVQAQAKLAKYTLEDRLSRSLARLLGARGQGRRSRRQRSCASRQFQDAEIVGAPRQAGRALALGLHAADGERVIQPHEQRDHVPRRHPAAAVLRRRCRRCDQLRRDRRGDRPRDQPRLRRPGPQVGRRRQPARLVDGRGCEEVRGARDQARRAVRVLHAAAGHEDQRPPDDGREHRRPERHRGGVPRLQDVAERQAGAGDRRLHRRSALLPRLRADLALQVARRGAAQSAAHRRAFAGHVLARSCRSPTSTRSTRRST